MALSANKQRRRSGDVRLVPGVLAANSIEIYEGAILVAGSDGLATVGATTVDAQVLGVSATRHTTGTGASTYPRIEVAESEWFANDGSITSAMIGATAFVLDDATVTTSRLSSIRAGRIARLETIHGVAGVWVSLTVPGNDEGALGPQRLFNVTPTPAVALASMGTDAVSTAGTVYFAELVVAVARLVTNIEILNGTVVGTDKVVHAIWSATGAVLGTSALAGALSAGADAYQSAALVTPIWCQPGRYFVGFQVEGTTAAHQTMAAGYTLVTGSQAGVFGTIDPIAVVPTTFTAGVGPFAALT